MKKIIKDDKKLIPGHNISVRRKSVYSLEHEGLKNHPEVTEPRLKCFSLSFDDLIHNELTSLYGVVCACQISDVSMCIIVIFRKNTTFLPTSPTRKGYIFLLHKEE